MPRLNPLKKRNDTPIDRFFVQMMILLTPLVYGMFFFFIFSLYYYLKIAPAVPIIFSTTIMLILMYRISAYLLPLLKLSNEEKLLEYFQKYKEKLSISSYIEILIWYLILLGLYWHLHLSFDFPSSISDTEIIYALFIGFLAFLIIAFFLNPVLMRLLINIRNLSSEFRKFSHAIRRISTVAISFLGIDIFFSGLYQFTSVYSSKSFDPSLISFADAFYYSTSVITIFGNSNFTPLSDIAKILTASETLVGILFVVVILAFVMDMPPEYSSNNPKKNA